MQSWASRFRRQKTSISDAILGPETRRKSFKTEVRKRMENHSPFGRHFVDFGWIWTPKTLPKISKKLSKFVTFGDLHRRADFVTLLDAKSHQSKPARNTARERSVASDLHFVRFRDDFRTLFWKDSGARNPASRDFDSD